MIKKILGFFIVGLGLVNISYGMAYIGSFGDNMLMSTNTNNYVNIDSNLNFSTIEKTSENYRDNILSVNYTSSRGKFVAGRINGQLYLYGKDGNKINQGYVSKVYKCSQERATANYGGNSLGSITPVWNNCTDILQTPNDYITNNINNFTYYAFGYNPSQNTVLCFTDVQLPDYGGNRYIDWYCIQADTSTSENFSITDSTTPDIILTTFGFGQSPFNSSGGGGDGGDYQEIVGIELGSDESAVNYFEKRYGRSENICYAGIDNVTTNWGSSVSFQEGTGLNIFQVFSGINNMSPDLNKVYVRLNSRLINYEQWFGRSGDPLYLSNYNTGTNQVDLYYDNLTFPFTNNPVAVYFLASNITQYSEYSTMGSEIVSYCNIKINNGSFDDIIDQAVKNNITKYTEQENKSEGLNPDGTQKPNVNLGGSDFGSGMWGGTGSWSDVEFTGDVDLKSFFDNAIENMQNAIDISDINPFTGVLPNYLIFAFLLVVLFKVLRH